jgi:hypothetical protein
MKLEILGSLIDKVSAKSDFDFVGVRDKDAQ